MRNWVHPFINERHFPTTTGLMPVAPVSETTHCAYLSSVLHHESWRVPVKSRGSVELFLAYFMVSSFISIMNNSQNCRFFNLYIAGIKQHVLSCMKANIPVILKFLSPTNAPRFYTYKMLKYLIIAPTGFGPSGPSSGSLCRTLLKLQFCVDSQ
jgi:hypothetical protein